jgi:chromosomal replication initiation ATPase DnaA
MQKRKIDQKVQYKQMKLNSNTLYVISQEINSNAANFMTNLVSQFEKKQLCSELCLVIQGNKGSGKTFVVHETMRQLGIRLLELNTSHSRDLKNIKKILSDAIKNFAVLQKELTSTVVFLDDIDLSLECDMGFEKAIRWVINESKCPVIMTCTSLPRNISFRDTKVLKLETSIDHLQLLYNERDRRKLKFSNSEILFLFRFYEANLTYLFNVLEQAERFNKENISLIPGNIIEASLCEIEEPFDVLTFLWNHVSRIDFFIGLELRTVQIWVENLEIVDVAEVPLIYLEMLCQIFKRHPGVIELNLKVRRKVDDLRSFGIQGDLNDFYSFRSLFNKKKNRIINK